MLPQFDHQLYTSYYLWFQNFLLTKGQTFVNRTGVFTKSADPTVNGLSCYPTYWKQMVYDSSISGAIIPTGLYISGTNTFLTTGSGLHIDYINGRALTTGNYTALTGAFSTNEYNFYTTANDATDFILESVVGGDPILGITTGAISATKYAAPCAILSLDHGMNEGFSFGGEDQTEITARAYIVSKNRWGADGIRSIFRDSNLLYFPIITNPQDYPLDYYNSLKTGYWNYSGVKDNYPNSNNWSWIKEVYTSNISEQKNKNETFFINYVEFSLVNVRFPRQ